MEESYKILSISRQCSLLGISRSRHYYQPSFDQEKKDFKLLARIREILLNHPYYSYRRVWREIDRRGHHTTEAAIRRVMRRFGVSAIFPGRNLSKACKYHKKYPYLLGDKEIRYPNQVWSTDITYIRMPSGNVYLMAIIDWYSRKALSWRVFNTMDGKGRALDYSISDEMYESFQYNGLEYKQAV